MFDVSESLKKGGGMVKIDPPVTQRADFEQLREYDGLVLKMAIKRRFHYSNENAIMRVGKWR